MKQKFKIKFEDNMLRFPIVAGSALGALIYGWIGAIIGGAIGSLCTHIKIEWKN